MTLLDNVTYARPYAKAVFGLALETKQLAHWSSMLAVIMQVCQDKQVKRLIVNPLISSQKKAKLIISVCSGMLDEQAQALLQLLARNKRLYLPADIKALFEGYRADYEKTITVEVISFMPLSERLEQALVKSLQLKLGRKVTLKKSLDKALLGGAVVRAGDRVIDGSLRSQLNKIARAIVE